MEKIVIIGVGFFGSVIAERIANVLEIPVTVLEKRSHIGGNCYSEIDKDTGIEYHKYGTHIFHTDNEKVWEYINRFTAFNSYRHQVLSTHKEKVFQMPINLETINSFYNINLKPHEVTSFLQKEVANETNLDISTFEGYTISKVGRPLYEAFIKNYTLKQWNIEPKSMSASIIKRLPFRTDYNESYYNSSYQGIPTDGYTSIFKKLLSNSLIDVRLNSDFFDIKNKLTKDALIIYSGPIDQYFDYCYGKLDWRTLEFEHEIKPHNDYQGTSVMNYADLEVPYTRIHEPKHLHPERNYTKDKTLIIKEYSKLDDGSNPYYPINDKRNQDLILKYKALADKEKNLIIAGRLGDYKYYDMHQTIARALEVFEDIKKKLEI
jgi:UDP-galactopyranose mutase